MSASTFSAHSFIISSFSPILDLKPAALASALSASSFKASPSCSYFSISASRSCDFVPSATFEFFKTSILTFISVAEFSSTVSSSRASSSSRLIASTLMEISCCKDKNSSFSSISFLCSPTCSSRLSSYPALVFETFSALLFISSIRSLHCAISSAE